MNTKKIALAVFFQGGVSLELFEKTGLFSREMLLFEELQKKNFSVKFFTYGKNDKKYEKFLNGVKIFPKKINIPNKLYELLISLIYRKELKKVDILRSYQMHGSIAATISKFLYKKKLVIRQGYQLSTFLKKMKKSALVQLFAVILEYTTYKSADKIILTTEKDKDYVVRRYKIDENKIRVIPNYIDTDLFKPFKLKKIENSLCFVGRFTQQKNLFNLLKAIDSLNVTLTIFGSGHQEEELKTIVKQNKLKVIFKGNIENKDLPKELNKHDLFILPSYFEGNPKVLLEAMSCGLSVIGTNVEGIKEIINHKENGYLCNTDAESLKKAIIEVLKNKNLQKKMKNNARKTILKEFSFKKILEDEMKIYEKNL